MKEKRITHSLWFPNYNFAKESLVGTAMLYFNSKMFFEILYSKSQIRLFRLIVKRLPKWQPFKYINRVDLRDD